MTAPAVFEWTEAAACGSLPYAQVDRYFFMDSKGGPSRPHPIASMVCNLCPVLARCRDHVDALEAETVSPIPGVYAGETPLQRSRRRADR